MSSFFTTANNAAHDAYIAYTAATAATTTTTATTTTMATAARRSPRIQQKNQQTMLNNFVSAVCCIPMESVSTIRRIDDNADLPDYVAIDMIRHMIERNSLLTCENTGSEKTRLIARSHNTIAILKVMCESLNIRRYPILADVFLKKCEELQQQTMEYSIKYKHDRGMVAMFKRVQEIIREITRTTAPCERAE